MLTDADIGTLYYTGIIVIGITLFLFNKYINSLQDRNKKFVFNPKIIEGFEAWINMNTKMYMTRYIEEKMGAELKQEDELNISTEFAKEGIDYVTASLLSQMPDFYKEYMFRFHGEDKIINSIRENVRFIFIKFIETMVRKRIGSTDTSINNEQNEEN